MSIISKIFGSYSQHQIRKIKKIADKVEALAGTYAAMSDEEMRDKTEELKNRLAQGETLDSSLPEDFALVREA